MTSEEIKHSVSMTDVVYGRYGFRPDRAGFIKCPFHSGDNTASLKVYKDSFYCFGCGASGDVFRFVMLMENISFREAYLSLGGTYEKPETRNEQRHRRRDLLLIKQKQEREQRRIRQMKAELLYWGREADTFRNLMKAWKPMSDEWCDCLEGYSEAIMKYDMLREEVSEAGTDR